MSLAADMSAPKGGVAPLTKKVANLSHVLRQAGRRFPDEIGFVQGKVRRSWSELDARVDAMAAHLASRGIGKGDRILVQSKNCPQLFEVMFVCFRLGAVWVPTNFRQTPDEVAYLASSSGAVAMFCHTDFPDHVPASQAASPDLQHVILIDPAAGAGSYDDCVARALGTSFRAADVDHDDPCWFFFTSGTTGRPKAAVLTHGQMGFVITNHLCDLMPGMTEKDAGLVVAPLSHRAGIHQLALTARSVKTVLLAEDKFDPAEAWGLTQEWRVSTMFTVPTILKMLVEHESVARFDHSSLRYVIYAGAPMYRADQKRALETLDRVDEFASAVKLRIPKDNPV